MNVAQSIYWVSLGVLILLAFVIALHPLIRAGIVGCVALGGVVLFALAGYDQPAPNWLVGLIASVALLGVYVALRWFMPLRWRDAIGDERDERRHWDRRRHVAR